MGMFESFHNLNSEDTYNCLINKGCSDAHFNIPEVVYDRDGIICGYTWNYGDCVTLCYNLFNQGNTNNKSLLYIIPNAHPISANKSNTKAYNLTDLVSWTCVKNVDGTYAWVQDSTFSYIPNEDDVYMDVQDYVTGKSMNITISNFRYRTIIQKSIPGSSHIEIPITSSDSQLLLKGTY